MTVDDLVALGKGARNTCQCPKCSALVCKGWESLPSGFDQSSLRRIGTLRDPADDEATFAEYHPAGTHGWSNDAPIALGWFPYNRCDIWACLGCGKAFLRYIEYGGYYTDERIRELQAHLVSRL